MRKLAVLILFFCVVSCGIIKTPEERAKRKIKKLLDKYPDISSVEEISSSDTITRLDSLIIKEVSIDTNFIFSSDTVFLVTEGNVSTEVQIYNRDRIRIKTLVQSDTIYFRDTLIREKTIIREVVKPLKASFLEKYGIILILLLIGGSCFVIYKIV